MRKIIKDMTKTLLYHFGGYDLLRFIQRNKVVILMYHRFSEKPEPFKVQKDVFEKQIVFLKKKYNFVSLSRYADVQSGRRDDLPPNSIILTIDDGYWDNYTIAYPILKRHSIPATIFITTDFVDKHAWLWANKLEYILKNTNYKQFSFALDGQAVSFDVSNFANWHKTQLRIFNHCATLPNREKDTLLNTLAEELRVDVPEKTQGDFLPLTWDQIREMNANGIDFGSHTCSHPILSRCTKEELEHEIRTSKATIDKMVDKDTVFFCYPNGGSADFNQRAVNILRDSGFVAAVTTIAGRNNVKKQDPFRLRRVSISGESSYKMLYQLISL